MKGSAVAVFVISITLAGCAAGGNEKLRTETETSISTKIVEGNTTKQEVREMFGAPEKTMFTDGGLEVWNYEFAKMSADAINYIPVVNLFGSAVVQAERRSNLL